MRFAPTREYPIHPPIKLAYEWGTPQLRQFKVITRKGCGASVEKPLD